jgi:hypothetical protein
MARQKAVIATYLLGVAVGRGMPSGEAAERVAALAAPRPVPAIDWRD